MTSHQALQGEPEGSGGGPSEEVEGSPVPPPGQGTEGRTAPGHVSAEDIIGNAEVGGADAEMAAPPADAPFPPSPPWTRPPLPSTQPCWLEFYIISRVLPTSLIYVHQELPTTQILVTCLYYCWGSLGVYILY
jgi:hypothetical protein